MKKAAGALAALSGAYQKMSGHHSTSTLRVDSITRTSSSLLHLFLLRDADENTARRTCIRVKGSVRAIRRALGCDRLWLSRITLAVGDALCQRPTTSGIPRSLRRNRAVNALRAADQRWQRSAPSRMGIFGKCARNNRNATQPCTLNNKRTRRDRADPHRSRSKNECRAT